MEKTGCTLCPNRREALGCPGLRKIIFCDTKKEPCSLEYKGECQTYQEYKKGLEEVKKG